MDELLLWRWSTAVQISSALLVALFFYVFGRSTQRPELRLWILAWLANAAALLVAWVFWLWQPNSNAAVIGLTALYLLSKSSFVLLLVLGASRLLGPAERDSRLPPWLLWVLLSCAVLGGLLLRSIDLLGLFQAGLIALVLGLGARICWRSRGQGLGWLGLGFALRALLASLEALGYGMRHTLPDDVLPDWLSVFLAAHSSFDTGAEWVIALGCVLAISQRMLRELADSHDELHQAHAELIRIAERDPLTGLYNRRMLPKLLAKELPAGSTLLFFDLDNFKQINDRQGHDAGDRCLRRFALELQESLTDADVLLRFAGDEFLALLPPDSAGQVSTRIEDLRQRLSHAAEHGDTIEFSVGRVQIDHRADLAQALRDADLAMYRDKARQRPDPLAAPSL